MAELPRLGEPAQGQWDRRPSPHFRPKPTLLVSKPRFTWRSNLKGFSEPFYNRIVMNPAKASRAPGPQGPQEEPQPLLGPQRRSPAPLAPQPCAPRPRGPAQWRSRLPGLSSPSVPRRHRSEGPECDLGRRETQASSCPGHLQTAGGAETLAPERCGPCPARRSAPAHGSAQGAFAE